MHLLDVLGSDLDQPFAMTPEESQHTDLIWRSKACLQQSDRVQVLNPLTIGNVALAPWNVFHMARIYQEYFEALGLEELKNWNPVNPSGLHRYGAN